MRTLLALVLSLPLAAGVAYACEGDKKCDKSHCNMPSTAATAELPADAPKAMLAVSGMTCGACADKVKIALEKVDGVKVAKVDSTTGKAEVAYDPAKTDADKLIAAVNATGHFTATAATN